jgi:hypothetical protein
MRESGGNMTRSLRCAVTMLALLLGACAPRTVSESAKQASYAGSPKRIYLFVKPQMSAQLGREFTEATVSRFTDVATKCGGVIESHIASSLELEPEAEKGRVAAFKPDVIMLIDFAGGTRFGSGYEQAWNPARIDTQLWEPGSTQLAWRAASEVRTTGWEAGSSRADSFTKDLIERMRADGVFPSCPR